MKHLAFILLAIALAVPAFPQSIPPPREASASQVSGGTSGDTYVSPRRLRAMFPSASGQTGKVLQSNGSNFVLATPTGATWGSVTGDITDQTDLNTALGLRVLSTTLAAYFANPAVYGSFSPAAWRAALDLEPNVDYQPFNSNLNAFGTNGSAYYLSRSNHSGTQSADTIVDGSTNKAYTAAEQAKLAAIAPGSTANDTDANLRARSSHTGTQSADTITDGSTNKAYTAAEQTKLAEIEAGAQVNRSIASQAEAEAGADNTKDMTPLRVAQAIAALAPAGGDISSTGTNTFLSGATVTFSAGTTLTLNGTLSGTPIGGTLDLSNVSVSMGTVNVNTLVPDAITFGSNVVPSANGGAGTVNGIMRANGSGSVSQAVGGTDYEPARTTVSQAAAEAGTSTTVYAWTPERVAQAIAALSAGGGSAETGDIKFILDSASVPTGWALPGANGIPAITSPDADAKAVIKMAGTVATPTFSPAAGAVASGTTITFSSGTSGVTFMTTNNTTDPSRSVGTAGGTWVVSANQTLEVMAYKDGAYLIDSAVASAAYTVTGGGSPEFLWTKFNEASGTTATSDVGPSFTGTVTGSFVSNGANNALQMDTGDAQFAADSTIAYGVKQVTVSAWIKKTASVTGIVVFSGGYPSFILSVGSGGWLLGKMDDVGTRDEGTDTSPLSDAAWHHVMVTFDASTTDGDVKFFVDGSEVAATVIQNDKAGSTNFATAAPSIKTAASSGAGFDVDDLRVYTGIKDATFAAALYGAGNQ